MLYILQSISCICPHIWVQVAFSNEFEYFYPFTFYMNVTLIYQTEVGAKNISISSYPSSQTLMCILEKWTASASSSLAYQYAGLANLERPSFHLKKWDGTELPGKSLVIWISFLFTLYFFFFKWIWCSKLIPNLNWFNWYNIKDKFHPCWFQLHH